MQVNRNSYHNPKPETEKKSKTSSRKRVERDYEGKDPDIIKKIRPHELAEELAFGKRKITKATLTELGKAMPDLFKRFQQLENLPSFEKTPMTPQEQMHLAYMIEVQVPQITRLRDTCFLSTGPRDVFVTKKRRVVIMAKPEHSVLAAKGSWKEVFSGVKLSGLDKPAKPVAVARIPLKNEDEVKAIDEEMKFYQKLKKAGVQGIAKPRFYTDITGMRAKPQDYVHAFPKEKYISHKVAAFDRYERSLEGKNAFSPEQKLSICRQIITTIKDIHDAGVIHWDLKRENILITREDDDIITAVTDFGLSFDKKKPYEFVNYGTAVSSAPELINQSEFKGDVAKVEAWSLGIVLYEILFDINVPWKEVLGKPEEFVKLPKKKQTTLLNELKKKIPDCIKDFEPRIKQLQRKKNLTTLEKLEVITYMLLKVDPNDRMSIDKAFQLINDLR